MGQRRITWIALLFLAHWSTGFKTKECDHDKTVETIKNIYQCFHEFQKELLKNLNLDVVTEGTLMSSL